MAITKEDLRRLLAADADLQARMGDTEPSDGELADQAAALQTAVSELGG